MNKKLYKSKDNKVIGGVCGGIAEVYDLDPTLVRLVTLFIVLTTGAGLLAYLVAWLIMPTKDEIKNQ